MAPATERMTIRNDLTVLYDGACPLCRRETAFYRRCRGAEALRWVDVSQAIEAEIAPGLTKERALARFHVRTAEGELLSGGRAFIRLWSALPGFRPLGAILRLRPVVWLLDRAYDLFLRVRPRLQTLVADHSVAKSSSLPDNLDRGQCSDHAGDGPVGRLSAAGALEAPRRAASIGASSFVGCSNETVDDPSAIRTGPAGERAGRQDGDTTASADPIVDPARNMFVTD